MLLQSIYILNRKLLIPGVKLTNQLTINRTRISRNYFQGKSQTLGFPDKNRGILRELKESAEIVLKQVQNLVSFGFRACQLTFLFGPIVIFGLPIYFCGGISELILVRWLRWSLSKAGATFIKLGQWAATRPDVLSTTFCNELAELQSNAPCHSMKWNEKVILKAFGKKLDQVFDDFESEPIGSGTIAQVHRAKIKKGSKITSVAVKISHPEIEKIIDNDLLLISVLAKFADFSIPSLRWISLPEEVACFSQMMREQLNLKFEAFTLNRFNQNFEASSKAWGHLSRIKFPSPHFPLISSNCLVEDLIEDSIPIGKISGFPANNKIKSDLAVLGFRGFLQMLLWDNFVHADLHPGNILVTFVELPRKGKVPQTITTELIQSLQRRIGNLVSSFSCLLTRIVTPGELPIDPREPKKIKKLPYETDEEFFKRQFSNPSALAQIVFLDTGLVTELSRTDFKNFTDLFQALVLKGDGYLAGELMIDRSPDWARVNVIDKAGFCQGLADIVKPIFAKRAVAVVSGQVASLRELRLDVILNRLFQLARIHHVRIDAAYTNLVMSLLCVEGLGRQLAPEMDLRPLLAQAALQYLIREH
jgi:aarF domain-containing kinase